MLNPNQKAETQTKAPFLIHELNDTIYTGIPIPARGKRINPDSVPKPKTVPLCGMPKVVPANTNVVPVKATPSMTNVISLFHYF